MIERMERRKKRERNESKKACEERKTGRN